MVSPPTSPQFYLRESLSQVPPERSAGGTRVSVSVTPHYRLTLSVSSVLSASSTQLCSLVKIIWSESPAYKYQVTTPHHDSFGLWWGKSDIRPERIYNLILSLVRVIRNVTCIDKYTKAASLNLLSWQFIDLSSFNNCSFHDNSQLIRVLAYGLTPVLKLH